MVDVENSNDDKCAKQQAACLESQARTDVVIYNIISLNNNQGPDPCVCFHAAATGLCMLIIRVGGDTLAVLQGVVLLQGSRWSYNVTPPGHHRYSNFVGVSSLLRLHRAVAMAAVMVTAVP